MYCYNWLNSLIKFSLWKSFFEIYRNKSCLPVMAMNNIRLKSENRNSWKSCFTEKCKLFYIFMNPAVWFRSWKIELIVNKIKCNSIILKFKYANILWTPCQINIKMCLINHIFAVFPWYTCILWNHDTNIEFILVKILWKWTNNICKSACLYKWHCLRCNKQNIFHYALLLHENMQLPITSYVSNTHNINRCNFYNFTRIRSMNNLSTTNI